MLEGVGLAGKIHIRRYEWFAHATVQSHIRVYIHLWGHKALLRVVVTQYMRVLQDHIGPVSYTHLTLPTKRIV